MAMTGMAFMPWRQIVNWPVLSTGSVVGASSTIDETTQVDDVVPPHVEAAVDAVPPHVNAAADDVGMNDMPAVGKSVALLYDADTKEWSYAR